MIKISKQDSIIDVVIKMKHYKEKEIVLEFPFGHAILHNYTSLRILKNNAKNKELIIITSDVTAKKIGKKLGIKYTLIKNTDLLEYNYSFSEYFIFLINSYWREIASMFKKSNFEDGYDLYFQKKKEQKTKIWIFFIGLLVSLWLFLFVFYFAVNKTSISITPDITIRTAVKNFNFEYQQYESAFPSDNIIPLKEITKLVYISEKFGTTGIDESSVSRATGEVIFYNKLKEKVRLRANTRVQTAEGIIYTTPNSIDIPAAFTDGTWEFVIWKKRANITAKLYDNSGNFIWAKGNTGSGVLLTLPWLKIDQDKIYAETLSYILGGTDDFIPILWKKDIENAKIILQWKLKDRALSQVKIEISENNKNNNITYEILDIDDIIIWSDLWITWDEELNPWDKMQYITLNGTIKITTYTYNTELVLNHLKSILKESILSEVEDIRYIDASSLRIALVISKQENPFKVKATAEVQASFSHNFLSKKNNYVEKLKYTIAGMNKEDAKKNLLNNSKISNVEISTRPFFMKNISSIPSNIEFIVEE